MADDSALVPLITRESSRSVLDYRPFRRADHAFSKSLKRIESGEVRIPSPLLTYDSPYIVLHFQFEPDGEVTSPQVPTGTERTLAVTEYTTSERIEGFAGHLDRLQSAVPRDGLVNSLAHETVSGEQVIVSQVPAERVQIETQQQVADVQAGQALPNQAEQSAQRDRQSKQAQAPDQLANTFAQQIVEQSRFQQTQRSFNEFQRRQMSNESNTIVSNIDLLSKPSGANASQGTMKAVWAGEELLLARTVLVNDREYIQGCLLDWPQMKSWLAGEINDLLPEAH